MEEVATSRHFFKVLIPGFQNKLKLPPALCTKLKDEKSEWAMLKSCKGRWKIGISRNCEGVITSFEVGWPRFVDHHKLSIGDFVVFEHVGGLNFNVLVFDPSACEKDFVIEPKRDKENLSDENKRETEKESVISFNSRNPHFVTTMQHFHATKKTLNIPIGFVRSNNLEKKTSTVLRNDGGREWWTSVVVRKVGQFRMSVGKGWHDFYDSNQLKAGDVCIFYLNSDSTKSSTNILFDVKICRRV